MMSWWHPITAGLAALLLMASVAGAETLASSSHYAESLPPSNRYDVGVFTAVEGRVAVIHPDTQTASPAKFHDTVLFKDVVETGQESRTKALLNDDSILTVGENSRVEVAEHIYDPNKGMRSVVVNLAKGKVRALVGKVFSGAGSKFEVHTPTASAAARGTYFVVFHVNGVSGIANIGTHGEVEFSSGGRSVIVPPGQFSVTPPGGGPPSPPVSNTGSHVLGEVADAVQGTAIQDSPTNESPKQTALASGGTAPVLPPSILSQQSLSPLSPVSALTTEGSGSLTTGLVPAVTSGAVPLPRIPPPPSTLPGSTLEQLKVPLKP
jgi:FecR-like protein